MWSTVLRALGIAAVVAALVGAAGVAGAEPETRRPCERGEFCLWPAEHYEGDVYRVALENTNPGECAPLPDGFDARSFVNRSTRPVTVYQGRGCATEGEFDTYPGGGTFVPAAPYVVRGVQIWAY
ncbi:peptidase inhibitor family I36 protein [Actinophytocola gossypii]|uniref:Peptidase inhibitor family I36 protein n=1 Tax=Actinophytocola gossypii TaxID=2812003 RepID=A0ABT2JI47_9PSEU|nr:peptidase inhibitor family I36 protein [Actinophytocola gossypii]MCT2587418.1 peptidase inhibitor family I36 protein [Actinophytocola gossypii]